MATAEEWVMTPRRTPGTGDATTVRGTLSADGLVRTGAVAILALVGTGGAITMDYVRDAQARGYRFPQFDFLVEGQRPPADSARAVVALESIRKLLPVSVSALAKAFGVSRQALYMWQRGEGISPRHEERLASLETAARSLAADGLAEQSVIRRPIRDGMSFLDLFAQEQDVDPRVWVDALRRIVRNERDERARMTDILAKRKKRPIDFEEASPAYPDESA